MSTSSSSSSDLTSPEEERSPARGSCSPSTSSVVDVGSAAVEAEAGGLLPLAPLADLAVIGLLEEGAAAGATGPGGELRFTRSRFPAGPPVQCPICGDSAVHRHFGGIVSCNGCAAFFRRTIVECKSYKCRKGNTCDLRKVKGSSICKYCRFQKCLSIGMVMKAVEPKRVERNVNSQLGILARIQKCRQAAFTDRYRSTIDVYGGISKYRPMSNKQKDGISALLASKAEFPVLRGFLRNSKFINHLPPGYDLLLSQRQLLTWITCESIYTNVKRRGFHLGRCYYVDDSFMSVNSDAIDTYLRSYPGLENTNPLVEYTFRFYNAVGKISEKMYQVHIDEEEMTALSAIVLLKEAISLLGQNEEMSRQLNEVFRALKLHYDTNYHDVALRMGNLIGFVEMLTGEVAQCRDVLILMMRLNDQRNKQPVEGAPGPSGYHEFLYSQSIRSQFADAK